MSNTGRPLSLLVIGVSHTLVERFISDFGFDVGHAEAFGDQAGAVAALNGRTHFDLIIALYDGPEADERDSLRQLRSLDHHEHTPVVMIWRQPEG